MSEEAVLTEETEGGLEGFVEEKFEYDAQKKADSIAEVKASKSLAATNEPAREIIREKTVYVNNPSPNNTVATSSGNQNTTSTTQKKGMSKAAKGTIIGTVGGAAAGAIINKKNRGLGAVIGGVVGGATGYTIGRAGDRKDGRVQPKN